MHLANPHALLSLIRSPLPLRHHEGGGGDDGGYSSGYNYYDDYYDDPSDADCGRIAVDWAHADADKSCAPMTTSSEGEWSAHNCPSDCSRGQ